MNEEIERIIEGLKEGSITISKVANKYRKDPLVQQTYLEIKNNKEMANLIEKLKIDIS